MNNNSNRDYATENINLKQQIMDLKKEIAELKDQVDYFKEEFEGWQSACEWAEAKNAILKLKNQELEEENQKLKKDYNLLDTTMESDDRIINSLLKEKEQLQNDIKLNETQIDDLTLEVANYKHALEEKNEIIMDLKEENQELKTTLLEYKAQENLYWNTATNNVNLREENEKLKKAIDFITSLLSIEIGFDNKGYYLEVHFFKEPKDFTRIELTEEEYNLLKEVLKKYE